MKFKRLSGLSGLKKGYCAVSLSLYNENVVSDTERGQNEEKEGHWQAIGT